MTGIRREAPALARNDHRLGVRLVLHGELRVTLLDVGGGIGPVPTIGQEQRRRGHVSLELRVHAPLDGPAAGVERVRPVEAQQAGQIGEVALPGAGEDDEAASHEEAVARVDGRIRIRARREGRPCGAVEVRHGDGIAPVDHVEEHAAAASRAIHGHQQRDLGRERHPSRFVPGGQLHVGDAGVGRVQGIEGEVQPPLELLVGSRVAERGAAGQGPPERDLEACHRHPALSLSSGVVVMAMPYLVRVAILPRGPLQERPGCRGGRLLRFRAAIALALLAGGCAWAGPSCPAAKSGWFSGWGSGGSNAFMFGLRRPWGCEDRAAAPARPPAPPAALPTTEPTSEAPPSPPGPSLPR